MLRGKYKNSVRTNGNDRSMAKTDTCIRISFSVVDIVQ